ncbi:ATP-binding cassette domain-containing protein [Gordonia sp. HY002]|uniref:ATP-binding cassette domain-containing protein n=1 Tax=Gordonia zhenghanii TaxID=2911516 RepID=UPI001EEF852A|nr:ATP-binding cassette domain-containing protein [Gordonia zhenghanii]MCF8568850.1 ATP-binding cassette domain-containing protein [Gordonia zhenghanii]MCF8602280.1 ATP-binding cassette domain-containing protein [Gordonia zhenghanii]
MTYTATPIIELTHLTKRYGDHQVLTDLSLTVQPGIHALLGPNGAGKTTLIDILTTLRPHDSGTAKVLDLDLPAANADIRRRISVTGQFATVDEVLTGTENLTMMGRLVGLSHRAARRRADELLDRFDLTDAAGRRASTYSGGMRRRLDLAVSLIWPPEILFLDEPTTGLDTQSRLGLWQQIRELAESGTNVFLTTQYLAEADTLADEVSVLHHGRIVARGSAAELKERVGGAVLTLVDDGIVVEEIPTDGSAHDIARLTAAIAADRPNLVVELRRPTLDDAFLQLTGHATRQEAA